MPSAPAPTAPAAPQVVQPLQGVVIPKSVGSWFAPAEALPFQFLQFAVLPDVVGSNTTLINQSVQNGNLSAVVTRVVFRLYQQGAGNSLVIQGLDNPYLHAETLYFTLGGAGNVTSPGQFVTDILGSGNPSGLCAINTNVADLFAPPGGPLQYAFVVRPGGRIVTAVVQPSGGIGTPVPNRVSCEVGGFLVPTNLVDRWLEAPK